MKNLEFERQRLKLGFNTLKSLADKIGVNYKMVSSWESTNATRRAFYKHLKPLGFTEDVLLTDAERITIINNIKKGL